MEIKENNSEEFWMREMTEQIRVARGLEPAELVLTNARVVNVLTREIYLGDVAIHHGRIAGVGSYKGQTEINMHEAYLCPGLIEGHIHLESSMLTPQEFVKALLPCGTTSAVLDPHEIGNVAGTAGIKYLLDASEGLPFSLYYQAPSCVPASFLEDSGAVLGASELRSLLESNRILGLAEVMNFPGVLNADPEVLRKLFVFKEKILDGHAPGVTGKDLQAYAGTGIHSEHEAENLIEGREKLRAGMYLMIREGSVAKNMAALLPLAHGGASDRCMLVSDDLLPADLLERRHLAGLLAQAVATGLDPIQALRMVTLNPAEYFHLHDKGRITPGAAADLVAFEDLRDFHVKLVVQGGKRVAEEGELIAEVESKTSSPEILMDSMHVADLSEDSFKIKGNSRKCRVIGLIPDQILTEERWLEPPIREGEIQTSPSRDIAKIAVIERHQGTGKIGLGLVLGLGLMRGALASSVAHDAHNLVVVGMNDADMLLAVREVLNHHGGLAAASDGKVLGSVPLPLGGLISPISAEMLAHQMANLEAEVHGLGTLGNHPFMTLSFLSLSVIPFLKITPKGLVHPATQEVVSIFGEGE